MISNISLAIAMIVILAIAVLSFNNGTSGYRPACGPGVVEALFIGCR